ncbi:MAG: hypothetical protein NTX86_01420 [Candidatus Dependentiae bacterium]|nr:hypothetical protein [Candidatus Dependentiae bacterium]
MNLNQLLAQMQKTPTFFYNYSVVCFQGNQNYPLLFFSLLCTRLKTFEDRTIEIIDLAEEDSARVQSKLQTSFLGLKVFYWFKNISDLDEKKRKFWLGYFQSYAGPHTLAFFVLDQTTLFSHKDHCAITMPDTIDQTAAVQVFSFFTQGSATVPWAPMTARLFKKHEAIPLDTACLLMHYMRLVGSNPDLFLTQWLDKILTPERSLFTLSTYFFAKKSQPFFQQWATISHDYPDVFWTSYWSEQLWRASYFITLMESKQLAEAKKVGARLPFSFIQRDWKLHTPAQLRAAHHALYTIDCAVKNGGSSGALDLLYSKFFSHQSV